MLEKTSSFHLHKQGMTDFHPCTVTKQIYQKRGKKRGCFGLVVSTVYFIIALSILVFLFLGSLYSGGENEKIVHRKDQNAQIIRSEVSHYAEQIQAEPVTNSHANGIYYTDHYWKPPIEKALRDEVIKSPRVNIVVHEELELSEEFTEEFTEEIPSKQKLKPASPVLFDSKAISLLNELHLSFQQLVDMKAFFSVEQAHRFKTANRDFQLLLNGYCELVESERETMRDVFLKGLNGLLVTFQNQRHEVLEKNRHNLKHRVVVIESRILT